MPDFATKLPESVKAAIDILVAAGFRAFTEAKLEDVRELDTGKRLRTFRNQGRYELVLAARSIDDLECAVRDEQQPDDTEAGEQVTAQKPLDQMNVAELRAEAKKFPEISGEYKMLKGDLIAAIADARRKNELLLKKFDT